MSEKEQNLFAKLAAESEQAKQGLREFGANLRVYFEGLREAGFTEAQSMELTQGFQSAAVMAMLSANDEDTSDES